MAQMSPMPVLKPEDLDRVERRYGAFRRSITLPAHVTAEGIQASFEDGGLQSWCPRPRRPSPPGSTRCLGRLHSDDNRAATARP
jgi:hypothetical protein